MKPISIFLVYLSGLIAFEMRADERLPISAHTGRFQLIAATVMAPDSITPAAQIQREPRLFRIDTITGQTWSYTASAWPVTAGTNTVFIPLECWSPASENYWESVSNITAQTASLNSNPSATNHAQTYKNNENRPSE